jgi:hypothetical protein
VHQLKLIRHHYAVQCVISLLRDKDPLPEITTRIKADSKEDFDRTTLDNGIKETLRQTGAKVEEWKEK